MHTDMKTDKRNPYDDLRHQALHATAERIGVTDGTEPYGVVMDWCVKRGTATLVSYASGDASIYLQGGGGVIGGYAHEKVRAAAKSLVRAAYSYLENSISADSDVHVCKTESVIFYFLTKDGIRTVEDIMPHMNDGTSPLLDLFKKANELIVRLREISAK
jgi:hypothetical protein